MNDYLVISAYGSHNAAISMYYKGEYTVVEVERWLNSKNIGLVNYMPCSHPQVVFDEITDYLLQKAGKSEVDMYITGYVSNIIPKFRFKQQIAADHHVAHAAAAFYQSPFDKSLVISFDGGGDGSYFNFYEADRNTGIKLLDRLPNDLGFPYMLLADYLDDIKRDPLSIGNLVYAGKLMGLCSYGTVREDWLPHFVEYYRKFVYSGDSYIGGLELRTDAVSSLFAAIGLLEGFDFETTRFSGQVAWDIAATTQRAFEEFFLELAEPYLEKYKHLPLSVSGGCGLNVLLNSRLLEMKGGNVFVPPNTNDCGISVGGILWHLSPKHTVDLTYSGLPVMDDREFSTYIQDQSKYFVYENVTVQELGEFVADNNIVGLIQGNSEHGSRALGNRSIICNPSGDMKDVLNHKVKHREWYRPFAPITRLEDANKYFVYDYNVESRHMTFVANVRDEWQETLPAITHTDGSARLQTVTRLQNELIYDLITEFEKHTGHGVILNTSFNVNGKPILTRLSDAFKILDESELDAIYYKGNLVFKKKDARKFKRSPVFSSKKARTGMGINAFVFEQDASQHATIEENLNTLRQYDNVVIITDAVTSTKFDLTGFHVYTVEPRHIYLKNYHGSTTVVEAFDKIRMLWTKEALNEDRYLASHHVFVDVAQFVPSSFNKELTNIITMSQNNTHLILSASRNVTNELFSEQWLSDKFGQGIGLLHPTVKFFGGSFEHVEWLSNQWEAMYLWYSQLGKISVKDHEYLPLAILGSIDKVKLIEE
ncbi:carbamoyl transferase [Xanthomonas phage Xoo-sp13]|nr:carbamoyl transferase [Xanthomonas phage Xoo-sp13]